jgi:uncharacterized protein (TIGR02001 family)
MPKRAASIDESSIKSKTRKPSTMKNLSKHFSMTLLAGAILGGFQVARAEEPAGPLSVSANVSLTSNYVWRGYTQSDDNPALQGGFDLAHESGFYAGTWGSNVEFADAHSELDAYLGYQTELGSGATLDLGYLRYMYPGATDLDISELKAVLGYQQYSLGYYYSPDFADSIDTHYLELGVSYPLPEDFTLDATLGYYTYTGDDIDDYLNWSLAVSKEFAGVTFKLAYTDTDVKSASDPDGLADARAVFSISKSF